MTFDVYRIHVEDGRVDYCGGIYAVSLEEAEMVAPLMYSYTPGPEKLCVEPEPAREGKR